MRVPSQSDNFLATMSAGPAKAAASKGAGQGFPDLIQAAKAQSGQDVVSQTTVIAAETDIEGTVPAVISTEAMPLIASTLKMTTEAKAASAAASNASADPDKNDDPLAETPMEFQLFAINLPGAPVVQTKDGLSPSVAQSTVDTEGRDAIDARELGPLPAPTKVLFDPQILVSSAAMPVQKPANLATAPQTEGTGQDLPDQLQDHARMPNIVAEDVSTPPNLNAQQDADAPIPVPTPADFTMDATLQIAAQPTVTQASTAPAALAGTQANPLDLSQSNWTEALVARLEQSGANSETGTLTLTLTPEKLGNLQIRLEHRDGLTHVHIVTTSPEASRIVMDAQHKLADQMARAGLEMGSQSTTTDLSQNPSQGGANFGQGRGNGPDLPLSAPSEPEMSRPSSGLAPVPETARRPAHAVDLMA